MINFGLKQVSIWYMQGSNFGNIVFTIKAEEIA